MIYLSILIAVLLIVIGALGNKYIQYKKLNEKKLSFFESLQLAGLPVITMTSNNVSVNLLLDTGSNKSFLDSRIIQALDKKKIKGKKAYVTGINNNPSETQVYHVVLNYKDNTFENDFQAFSFEKTMDHLKKSTGVRIDGIIGSDFLSKYNYILDYEEYVAYNK